MELLRLLTFHYATVFHKVPIMDNLNITFLILANFVIRKSRKGGQLSFRYGWSADLPRGQGGNWWPFSDLCGRGIGQGWRPGVWVGQPHAFSEARLLYKMLDWLSFSAVSCKVTLLFPWNWWNEWSAAFLCLSRRSIYLTPTLCDYSILYISKQLKEKHCMFLPQRNQKFLRR